MNPTMEDTVAEEQAFLTPSSRLDDAVWSQERKGRKVTRYLRIALEVGMALTIIALLAYILRERVKRSPVPTCMSSPNQDLDIKNSTTNKY